jgi:hypothetical protein
MSRSADWIIQEAEEAARARLAEVRAVPAFFRGPRPFGAAIARALAPVLKQAGPAPTTLASRWAEIVGQRIAAVTTPVRVARAKSGNVLHLRVTSAAAPMIQHAAEHIMQRVNLASGSKITTLRIVHTAAAAILATPRRQPLTPEQRVALTQALTSVRTPGLRSALAELGEAVLAPRQRS